MHIKVQATTDMVDDGPDMQRELIMSVQKRYDMLCFHGHRIETEFPARANALNPNMLSMGINDESHHSLCDLNCHHRANIRTSSHNEW